VELHHALHAATFPWTLSWALPNVPLLRPAAELDPRPTIQIGQIGHTIAAEEALMPGKAGNRWPLVLAATAIACGVMACASQPPRTAAQREADAATTARVQAALAAQTDLYSKDIVVSVYDGVVNLSGMAWSSDAIYTAGHIAGAVAGVKSVNNQIAVESSQFGR
jgi:hypothetical protein